MDSNEQYVREKWKKVAYCETGLTPDGPCYVTISDTDHPTAGSLIFMTHGSSKEAVFEAAADFTRAHEKKISDVEEEVALLKVLIRVRQQAGPQEDATCQRILAARQAALDEIRKGWKG